MLHAVAVLAKYTFIEAVRSRLFGAAFIIALLAWLAGSFLGALAITDADGIRATALAAVLRLGSVLLMAGMVVTSLAREQQDKGLELLLSLPMARASYVLGRASGFVAVGVCISAISALPLLGSASVSAVLLWGVSLSCELALIVCVSLLAALTFSHNVLALLAVAAFYALARVMATLLTIGTGVAAARDSLAFQVSDWGLRAIAAITPRLDLFTQASWLTSAPPAGEALWAVFLSTLIFGSVALGAALVDFYRKNV
jgi:hypothetical protein